MRGKVSHGLCGLFLILYCSCKITLFPLICTVFLLLLLICQLVHIKHTAVGVVAEIWVSVCSFASASTNYIIRHLQLHKSAEQCSIHLHVNCVEQNICITAHTTTRHLYLRAYCIIIMEYTVAVTLNASSHVRNASWSIYVSNVASGKNIEIAYVLPCGPSKNLQTCIQSTHLG